MVLYGTIHSFFISSSLLDVLISILLDEDVSFAIRSNCFPFIAAIAIIPMMAMTVSENIKELTFLGKLTNTMAQLIL